MKKKFNSFLPGVQDFVIFRSYFVKRLHSFQRRLSKNYLSNNLQYTIPYTLICILAICSVSCINPPFIGQETHPIACLHYKEDYSWKLGEHLRLEDCSYKAYRVEFYMSSDLEYNGPILLEDPIRFHEPGRHAICAHAYSESDVFEDTYCEYFHIGTPTFQSQKWQEYAITIYNGALADSIVIEHQVVDRSMEVSLDTNTISSSSLTITSVIDSAADVIMNDTIYSIYDVTNKKLVLHSKSELNQRLLYFKPI